MSLLSWGCVIQDLRLSGHQPPLVLGFSEFRHYPAHSRFFGATVGRYANRIAHGRFSIDGVTYQCDLNFLGRHTLHGGSNSLGRRNWRFSELTADKVVLEISDHEGEMGFPGTANIRAVFSLPGEGRLHIRYEATTDAPTLLNLAHHSYFNLAGGGDILDHELEIAADSYLPVDDEAIPLGKPVSVANTAFDFRKMRPIKRIESGGLVQYDHNFCLADRRRNLTPVARLRCPSSCIEMAVSTTEPGVQLYDAATLAVPVPGLTGGLYGSYAGLCMEPQVWPDSPNHADYPQAILRPGEIYEQETEYRFVSGHR
jgi:aldose 1-epimerase